MLLHKKMNKEKTWITIDEPLLSLSIIKSIADEEKNEIINTAMKDSMTVLKIIQISKVPKTSGYRKVKALIRDGLLIPDGYITTRDRKKVTKYRSLFENVNIAIEKNKVTVSIVTSTSILAT